MANIQELKDAFMRAHRAGDEKNARILANALERQLSSQDTAIETPKKPEPESGMGAAFRSGLSNLEADRQAILSSFGVEGAEAKAAAARQRAAEQYKQPEFLDQPLNYIGGLAAQSAPYMVAPIVAGGIAASAPVSGALGIGAGVAGLLGAGAASAGQFTGSNLSRQLEKGVAAKDLDVTSAVVASIPQAALDTISLRMIPGLRGILGKAGVEITEEQAAKIARDGIIGTTANAVKAYGPSVLKTAGTEGLTESAQQVLERAQAGLSITDPEARKEYYDSFIGGAVLGGTFAVPGRALERGEARSKYEEAARVKKEAEAKTAAEAEVERRKGTPYLLDELDATFNQLQEQKAGLLEERNAITGGKKKLPKDATPEQREAYTALTEQLKENERLLYKIGPEYAKNKDAIAAAKEQRRMEKMSPQDRFLYGDEGPPVDETATAETTSAEQPESAEGFRTLLDLPENQEEQDAQTTAFAANQVQQLLDSKLEGLRYHDLMDNPSDVADVLASDGALAKSFLNNEITIAEFAPIEQTAGMTKKEVTAINKERKATVELIKKALPLKLQAVYEQSAPEMEEALAATERQRKVEKEKDALQRIAAKPTPVATESIIGRGIEREFEQVASDMAPGVAVEPGLQKQNYTTKATEAKTAHEAALSDYELNLEDLVQGRTLDSARPDQRKLASSTKETLQNLINKNKEDYINGVLQEAANLRAAEKMSPITQQMAQEATERLTLLLNSVANKAATIKQIQPKLAAVRAQLAIKTPAVQKQEKPLKLQGASAEAAKTEEARGDTAKTLEGQLRRKRDYVASLIERALGTRTGLDESLRNALVAAQESAENGTATNELLDAAEDAASRLLRGQDTTDAVAPIESALKSLSEAQDTDTFLSLDKKSEKLQKTTGAQKTLFDTVKQTNPEMAENLGVIRATANNFRKFLASATVAKLRKAIADLIPTVDIEFYRKRIDTLETQLAKAKEDLEAIGGASWKSIVEVEHALPTEIRDARRKVIELMAQQSAAEKDLSEAIKIPANKSQEERKDRAAKLKDKIAAKETNILTALRDITKEIKQRGLDRSEAMYGPIIQRFEERVKEFETRLKELQASIPADARMSPEMDELFAEVASVQEEIENARAVVKEARSRLETRLYGREEFDEEKLKEAEDVLAKRTAELRNAKQTPNISAKRVLDLQNQVAAAKKEVNALRKERNVEAEEDTSNASLIAAADERLKADKKELADLEKALKKIDVRTYDERERQKEADKKRAEIVVAEKQLNELKAIESKKDEAQKARLAAGLNLPKITRTVVTVAGKQVNTDKTLQKKYGEEENVQKVVVDTEKVKAIQAQVDAARAKENPSVKEIRQLRGLEQRLRVAKAGTLILQKKTVGAIPETRTREGGKWVSTANKTATYRNAVNQQIKTLEKTIADTEKEQERVKASEKPSPTRVRKLGTKIKKAKAELATAEKARDASNLTQGLQWKPAKKPKAVAQTGLLIEEEAEEKDTTPKAQRVGAAENLADYQKVATTLARQANETDVNPRPKNKAGRTESMADNFANSSEPVKRAKEEFGTGSAEAVRAFKQARAFFFERLDKSIKDLENAPPSDFDEPTFRLGNPVDNPVDAKEAQAFIDKLREKLPSSIKLVYAKSLLDVPGKLIVKMAKAGMDVHADRVKGAVMPDGTVLIIGDTHGSIKDLEETVAHELTGHYGVDALLGESGMKSLLASVEKFDGGMMGMAEKLGVADDVAETALEYAKRHEAAKAKGATKEELNKILNDGKIQSLREMIAHVEETRADKNFIAKAKEFIQTLIGAVRAAFKKMGFTDLSTASTSDIYYLLRQSRQSIKNKTVGAYKNPHGEVVFSRQVVNGPKIDLDIAAAVDKIVASPQTVLDRIQSEATGIGARTMFIDRLAPMERVAEHLKKSAQAMQMLYYGRIHDQRMSMTGEVVNNGAPTLEQDKKGNYVIKSRGGANLADIAKEFANVRGYGNAEAVRNLFTGWLAAKRAKDPRVGKAKLNFNENVTQEELDRIEALGDQIPAFEKARDLYNKYNKGLIDWLKQAGTIDEKTYNLLTSMEDYIPYYRAQNDNVIMEIAGIQPFTIGNLQRQPYLKELIGGDEKIQDFFTSSLQNTAMLVDMGLSNLATKEIAFSLQSAGLLQGKKDKYGEMRYMFPGPGPAQPNIIRFKRNGKEYYAVVESESLGIPSELLVKGLHGTPTVLGGVTKIMAIPARFLRAMVTRSPVYMVRQLLRDSTSNFLLAGGNMTPVASAAKELAKMYAGKSVGEKTLQERGIIGGQILSGTSEDMQKIMLQLSKGGTGWEAALAKLDRMSMASDAASRITLYNSYIAQGLSDMEATLATLESMNFSKRGASGSLYAMNMMIPFLNAQIQGLDVLYKAFTGKLPYSEKLNIQRKLYTRGLMITGMTVAYAAMMQDDDAYKNANMRDRLGNWFIRIPGVSEPIKIPIPFEVGLIFKALPEAMLLANDKDRDVKEVLTGLGQLVGTSVPFGPSSVPQAVKPIIEASVNKSFFTGQDIESEAEKGLIASERVREKTSGVAKFLGETIGVSPVMVDHFINGYTGGLGLAIAQAAGTILPLKPGPEAPDKRLSEMPVVGSMFQPNDAQGQISLFYEKAKEFDQAKNTFDKMLDEGRGEDAKAFAEKYASDIAMADVAESFKSTMGEFTEMEKLIKASDLSGAEKLQRLKEIRATKIEFARSFNASARQQ
jgi:hypothetical protein